ncbi:hypothetical protein CERZMDRAFT_114097 [Cercospora zeae-maydis SCOH1-5]|uniref:isopentenyl-diphosphate Delta-isomerase n=1 Tax=Cercospora zeae-maydis SCOH1-5 TaxID=717836 RepID=A0A6A6F3V0_9PEZI|nr:hypothetical protein CERZMDRAFT_114097 [Cercospora zeae-maydis SCOH1-5]
MDVEQHGRSDSANCIQAEKEASKDVSLSGYNEEQVRLMAESCIVVDTNDRPLGAASKKDCHLMSNIDNGLLHRAFSVFLFDGENRLLLQQRASEKITFPDRWTNACCSHPLSVSAEQGDGKMLSSAVRGVKRAAARKLMQELGIPTTYIRPESFKFLGRIHYKAASDGIWGEHEIDYILFLQADVTIKANANEVRDWKYVTMHELRTMLDGDGALNQFTPWFRLICRDALFQWWDLLQEGRLEEQEEFSEIRRMTLKPQWEPNWPRRGTLRRGEDY